MRILFISSIFPHACAPVTGTFNLELCRALAAEHDLHVVAPRSWIDVARSPAAPVENVVADDLKSAGLNVSYPVYFYPPKVLRQLYGWFMWTSVRKHLQRVIREFRPDVVLSYWAHPDGEVGLRAARMAGVPSAVIVGGSDVLVLTKMRRRCERVLNVLRNSNAVVTVSEGLRKRVAELGIDAGAIHTVFQGTDVQSFCHGDKAEARKRLQLRPDRKMLVWVGRLVEIKGLDVLLEACSLLAKQSVEFQLNLVGEGPLRQELELDARRRGLADRVRFVGAVGHAELADWYRAADATVMSSWSEGLPNVLRESLACGTPFVSTNVGSIAEIADTAYSILVPAGDCDALCEAIQEILGDSYAKAARDYQPQSWSNSAAELCELLQSLPVNESRKVQEPVELSPI